MNFLAHIYLSGNDPLIRLGGFIADSVKGNQYKSYNAGIQKGILLHRQIDWFTDQNEIVRKSKHRLPDKYGHYRGVIIDIFYDHFLAKNWRDYHTEPLELYVQEFYDLLKIHADGLPPRVQHMLPYLFSGNWLYSYASEKGIAKVLNGMNNRTKGKSHMNEAITDLRAHYIEFESDFMLFFEKVRKFSNEKLIEINED